MVSENDEIFDISFFKKFVWAVVSIYSQKHESAGIDYFKPFWTNCDLCL